MNAYKKNKLSGVLTKRMEAAGTRIFLCGNCKRPLCIARWYYEQEQYKTFYCDKQCEAAARTKSIGNVYEGGYKDANGYIVIRRNGRAEFQHRAIFEEELGRPLRRDEHVHHLNGIRDDNRRANLVLISCHDHPSEASKLITSLRGRVRELEHVLAEKAVA